MKKVIVDKNVCIGCGFCTNNMDEVFVMDDDDLAVAKEENMENMSEEKKEQVKDMAEGCPVSAIKIEE